MKRSIIWRSLLVILAVCISAYIVIARPLNRGLDLAGGTHFTIEIMLDDIAKDKRADAMESALAVYRNRINEIGVAGTIVQQSGQNHIIVQVPGIETAEADRIKDILKRTAHLEFKLVVDGPGEPIKVL